MGIKKIWSRLIGEERLPSDHYQVYKAITKYAYVDRDEAYERLGYKKWKPGPNDFMYLGYSKSYKKMCEKPLCNGTTFREKIAGSQTLPSIINVNQSDRGIPQGAPLSDLLANAYLLDFDKFVLDECNKIGGIFYRYSDDILIIAPISAKEALKLEERVRNKITELGSNLIIKEEKSSIHQFEKITPKTYQVRSLAKSGYSSSVAFQNRAFEYLGFRFDGNYAYLRASTMSRLYRKVSKVSRAVSVSCCKRYRDKEPNEIIELAIEQVMQRFGRVRDFYKNQENGVNYNNWTFYTYSQRASKIMGNLGRPIPKQLRNSRKFVSKKVQKHVMNFVQFF